VDEVIRVESLERAFSKEAGDESSRAKGHREGMLLAVGSQLRYADDALPHFLHANIVQIVRPIFNS
jgi:hypothetical protein